MRIPLLLAVTLATLVVGNAHARDEYVNPVFCYRLVLPEGVSGMSPHAEGGGIDMASDARCGRDACVRISVVAGYLWDDRHKPRGHQYYDSLGWTSLGTREVRTATNVWSRYLLSRDGALLSVHEHIGRNDQINYIVTAQYRKASAPMAARMVGQLLSSWQWLSACL